jgi:ubiquinone/menaquinone biosynthesis C-methylase UbiE
LLDEGAGTLDDVKASLNDLRRLNRYLGGTRSVMGHLLPRLMYTDPPFTVLDIGTGDASLPLAITRHTIDHDISVQVTGLDLMPRHLAIARERVGNIRQIQLLQGDALHLPYADNSIDFVICSLLLHHFTRDQVIQLLREAYRCTRRAIIMSDLVRSRLSYLGFKLIQPVFSLHPFTRQDGEVSIMRSFTPDELEAIAHEAGLTHATLHRHLMFRMTLVADK